MEKSANTCTNRKHGIKIAEFGECFVEELPPDFQMSQH
jgi:hypothetical protein